MSDLEWSKYKACPTCRASAGEPCVHTVLQTTRGKDVRLDSPHQRRKAQSTSERKENVQS